MAALHNLYDFLDEFIEIFGEKAEYEIKSMLDNTITVKMIYKRALPPAQFQPDISNPFDNIAMEGIDSPDVYDRYATAEVKVECSGNGKVNFSAKIGDPSFPEILVSDKRLKRFLDAKTKFCGEFQQNADGSGVYVDIDADFVRATIEAGREQMRKLQYMIATHDDISWILLPTHVRPSIRRPLSDFTSPSYDICGLSVTHISYFCKILMYFSSSSLNLSYTNPTYREAFSESLLTGRLYLYSFDKYPPHT